MPTTSTASKSTNVQTVPLSFLANKLGMKLMAPMAPGFAARWAGRLFMTARKHPRPAWEVAQLDRGRPFRIAYGDSSLAAWSWGQGPLVVLVHGWEGRGSQMGAFVEPLLEAGYRVVTFDAPAHGDSPGELASQPQFADALQALLEVTGPASAIIAHSMGAATTTLAQARAPELFASTRLVYIASPVSPHAFAELFCRIYGIGKRRKAQFRSSLESTLAIRMDELHVPSAARGLRAPLLLIHDEHDKEVPLSDGQAIVDAWPGAKLLVTRKLGHRRILREPLVVQSALHFVRGHAPPSLQQSA